MPSARPATSQPCCFSNMDKTWMSDDKSYPDLDPGVAASFLAQSFMPRIWHMCHTPGVLAHTPESQLQQIGSCSELLQSSA